MPNRLPETGCHKEKAANEKKLKECSNFSVELMDLKKDCVVDLKEEGVIDWSTRPGYVEEESGGAPKL